MSTMLRENSAKRRSASGAKVAKGERASKAGANMRALEACRDVTTRMHIGQPNFLQMEVGGGMKAIIGITRKRFEEWR